MRFKTTLLILAVLLMTVPALAGTDKPAQQKMDIDTFLKMHNYPLSFGSSKAFFEGFEGGVIPVTWTETVTNVTLNWDVSNSTSVPSVEGFYCAFVGYDMVNPQDETISFDYALTAGDDQLSFYMGGSRTHSWSGNVKETVEVNGVEVFDFDTATNTDYTMERFDVDLSAWDGQTVTIAFRYYGLDGDLHVLDAVTVDDGTGWVYVPPQPPENDDCAGAIAIGPGAFNIDGDTSAANPDYDTDGSCTGYGASGNDVVYIIGLNHGDTFDVTMTTSGWDDSIYLVTDCANTLGTCVAGADAYPDGSTFSYTNDTGVYAEFYLIVDAYSSGMGTFNISGNNGGVVETRDSTWGSVKSLYR